jgi:ELWxxDGT repeat protein
MATGNELRIKLSALMSVAPIVSLFVAFVMFAAPETGESSVELFANINQTDQSSGSPIYGMNSLGSTLYFSADDGLHGQELWKSAGTQESTKMVADLSPGPLSTYPQILGSAGSYLYFAVQGENAIDLWRTDQFDQVQRIISFSSAVQIVSGQKNVSSWKNILFFIVQETSNNFMLWETEGTRATTRRLLETDGIQNLTPTSSALFFSASLSPFGQELWRTDGTNAGTVLVKDINPGEASSFPEDLMFFGNFLIFSANDGLNGRQPWRTAGTTSSTTLIQPISCCDTIQGFGHVGTNGVVFAAGDSKGVELWKMDPFFRISFLKDIWPGRHSSSPHILASNGNLTFFTATTNKYGEELWVTDGTPQGTHLVKNISAGSNSTFIDFDRYTLVGNKFFFETDFKIWVSDGTEEGTFSVGSSIFEQHEVINEFVYFDWFGNIWRSDGTVAGTERVATMGTGDGWSSPASLVALGSHLYFAADDGLRSGFWRTDGTSFPEFLFPGKIDQAVRLNASVLIVQNNNAVYSLRENSRQVRISPIFYAVSKFVPAAGKIFFKAAKNIQQYRMDHYDLWVTDGTNNGTRMVPFTVTSGLDGFKGKCYFHDDKGLWQTDGFKTIEVFRFVDQRIIQNIFTSKHSMQLIIRNGAAFEVWLSDGSRTGTRFIAITPAPMVQIHVRYPKLFFTSSSEPGGYLWALDLQTKKFTKILQQEGDFGFQFLGETSTTVIYAQDKKLFKTNGTLSGTSQIAESVIGSTGAKIDDQLYFLGCSEMNGCEPWVTDGSVNGTRMLSDIYVGPYSSSPYYFRSFAGSVWFAATDADHGRELFRLSPN